MVYDLDTQAARIVESLSLTTAERAATALTDALPEMAFAVETGYQVVVGPGYRHICTGETEVVQVKTLAELWSVAPSCVKLLAWSPTPVTRARLALVAALLPTLTVTYSGGSGMIEISAAGVSKVATLQGLCALWGYGPNDVVAFGDMPNDLSVLQWAGLSIAMANAHPDVLSCADRVTTSNDDDGVALVLEDLFRTGSSCRIPRLSLPHLGRINDGAAHVPTG